VSGERTSRESGYLPLQRACAFQGKAVSFLWRRRAVSRVNLRQRRPLRKERPGFLGKAGVSYLPGEQPGHWTARFGHDIREQAIGALQGES